MMKNFKKLLREIYTFHETLKYLQTPILHHKSSLRG
jgi:hypothetical protein